MKTEYVVTIRFKKAQQIVHWCNTQAEVLKKVASGMRRKDCVGVDVIKNKYKTKKSKTQKEITK